MNSLLHLRNASVVLPTGVLESATVVIEAGRLLFVEPGDAVSDTANATTIDLTGMILFPGFIDVHIHGAVGHDVMVATATDLHEVSQFLATQGITSWLPTLVPGSDEEYQHTIARVKEAMLERSLSGARILGVHYEGPFVNTAQCGALHQEHFKTYAAEVDLDRFPFPASGSKMMTLAPEIEGGVALVQELSARGWVTSIGHTRAGIDVLDQAFHYGARHMTHFMNAMAPLHHRSPGPIAWGLQRDEVTFDLIADGIHLDPFVLSLLLKLKGPSGITLISDSIAAAGKGDGDYRIWDETITVRDGRTSNASGSIAGSVITMLDAVRVMRSVGASEVDVAQMASLNPARLLGLDQEYGSIEVGKQADLVALDQSGSVTLTLVGGTIAYQA